jgi:hypothetical protein
VNPEPLEIIVGDTVSWVRRAVIAYSVNDDGTPEETEIKASDGWTLKFVAVGKPGVFSITAVADTENVDDFIFTVAAATTAAYTLGDYQWQLVATKTTTRYTIALGRVTLLDNIAVRNALYDNRSHAKKVLDAIEAVLEGRASRQDQAYTIAGRSLQLTPIPDLIKLRTLYKREYESELATASMKSGRGTKRKILTRFINPR